MKSCLNLYNQRGALFENAPIVLRNATTLFIELGKRWDSSNTANGTFKKREAHCTVVDFSVCCVASRCRAWDSKTRIGKYVFAERGEE